MSGSKHVRNPNPNDADLTGNPGIGTSPGAAGEDDLDGETTFEGDVLSDATPEGGVNPDQRGRTNK